MIEEEIEPIGAADRRPALDQLVRRQDLERLLQPFLAWGLDGILLFDRDGAAFGGALDACSPLRTWDQLPAEAQTTGSGGFGLLEHRFEVRPMYAGADRVGVVVFSFPAHDAQRGVELGDALTGVLGHLLQAGFATWVTSELHLAASESSHRALHRQNAELARAVEHLRDLDKLKSNFLATVSHELRTPLTSVIGFAEMLLEGIAGDLAAEQREYVATILERGEELLRLITQILEMSRLEVGAVRLDLQAHDVCRLVDRAIAGLELAATKAKVVVRSEVVAAELPPVLVDADKVQQVLTNLVGNAVKFTRAGGSVTISAAKAPIRRPFEEETLFGEEDANAVRITVRDSGIGIPEEQLERIFEAFYQVDSSPTRERGGAGLGLSIVKNLVSAHGGDVWAESTVGVGTSLSFTLPVATDGASRR